MLRWLSFSQAATGSYAALAASFTPIQLQVISVGTSGNYKTFNYRFSITSGALPAWIQPGTAVNIAASVTVNGVSNNVSDAYVVRAIDPLGLYFDVDGVRPHGSQDAVAFTQTFAATNLDSGSGVITTPLVSLLMQCQKAMLQCTAGSVLVAPVVDHAGNAPYTVTLAAGGSEYEITAQYGSKFDLSDLSIKQVGSGTLAIRFL